MGEHPLKKQAREVLARISFRYPTAVPKVARSGATTGLIANAIDQHKKFLLVAPTKVIAHEIINDAIKYSNLKDSGFNEQAFPILANTDCLKNQRLLKEYPKLYDLPYLPLPSCDKCGEYEYCPITAPIRNSESTLGFGMTYDKLNAIMMSDGSMAHQIKDIIMKCEVIVFDEAHYLEQAIITNSIPIKSIMEDPMGRRDTEYWNISEDVASTVSHFYMLVYDNITTIYKMGKSVGESEIKQTLMCEDIHNIYRQAYIIGMGAVESIIRKIKNEELDLYKGEIINLINIIQLMSENTLHIHAITTEDGDEVFIISLPVIHTSIRMFLESMQKHPHDWKIIFTTATFGDMQVYEDVFGEYDVVRMEDVLHTNRMVTVYPDTFTLNSSNIYGVKRDLVVDECCKYAVKYPGIRFIMMRKKDMRFIKFKLEEYGIEKPNVDWYNSTRTLGVASDERRCVCVGAPIMPLNVYDPIARSWEHSQQKRIQANHASWYQAVNRFKDPQGEDRTEIFCIGITKSQIEEMVKWGGERSVNIPLDDHTKWYNTKIEVESGFESFMMRPKTNFLTTNVFSIFVLLLSTYSSKKLVLKNALDGFIKVRVDDKGVKWDTDMIDGHFNGSPIIGYDINKEGFSNVGSITLDDPVQRDTLISYLESDGMPFMLERIGDKFTFWFFFDGVKSDVVFKLIRGACMMGGVKQRGEGRAEIHPIESELKSTGVLGHHHILPFATGSEIIHPRKLIPLDEFEIGVITI